MKVGDFVRNKYGIAKVIDIENNNGIDILVFDKPICFLVNKKTGKIKDDRLLNRLAIIDGVDVSKIKSSPNIIDLIEKNDLIKYRIHGDLYISEVHGHPEFDKYKLHIEYSDTIINLEDLEIVSVLTHEQFSQMEYKL